MEAKYVSGIKIMDEHHQVLISMIEDLHQLVGLRKINDPELIEVRRILTDYVATHFKYEEDLMAKYSYPYIDDHVAKHRYIKDHVESIFDSGTLTLDKAFDILVTMNSWLLRHILKDDFELAEFLKREADDGDI